MDEEAIERREAEVLGDGARVKPMAAEDCPDNIIELSRNLMRLASNRKPVEVLEDVPEYFKIMFKHPELCAVHSELGIFLLGYGSIEPRLRELAILRVGWLVQAPYEWGEHVFVGKRIGMSPADFERVREGSAADGWSEIEAAVLCAVEELLSNALISDATWAVLARHFDDRQLIELPILVGQYQGVAYLQNALRFQLHAGNPGLRAI